MLCSYGFLLWNTKAITKSYHLAYKHINHIIEKSSQGLLKNKFTFCFTEKKDSHAKF